MGQEENIKETDCDIPNENDAVDEDKNCNYDHLRTKMDMMRKRIDALKERIEYEGWNLHSENSSIKSDSLEETLSELSNLENCLSSDEKKIDKPQCFSASTHSLLSTSSCSMEGAYLNFNEFVKNFLKDHSQKERLNFLQMHSNKQISLNMMKQSLSDLNVQCTKELKFIEGSLEHLSRLATEFGVNIKTCHKKNDCEALRCTYTIIKSDVEEKISIT